MSRQLTRLAEDLERALSSIKPKKVVPPSVTEKADVGAVAQTIFEYVIHRAPEDATPVDIGEALRIGVDTAAYELGLKSKALLDAVDDYVKVALAVARQSG